MTPEELQAALTTARLRVNDWHACASADELARWRADQASLIIAAKASVYPEVEALSAKVQEAEKASALFQKKALDWWAEADRYLAQRDELTVKLQEVQAERDQLRGKRGSGKCDVQPHMSRVCERGVGGCVTRHLASRGEIETLSAKLLKVRAERDRLELERDEKAAIIKAAGHELDELRARVESAKARQAAAEHRAQPDVLLEIEASRGNVVQRDWMPIASAPKDGTVIRLTWANTTVEATGRWAHTDAHQRPYFVEDWRDIKGGDVLHLPSHWRPV